MLPDNAAPTVPLARRVEPLSRAQFSLARPGMDRERPEGSMDGQVVGQISAVLAQPMAEPLLEHVQTGVSTHTCVYAYMYIHLYMHPRAACRMLPSPQHRRGLSPVCRTAAAAHALACRHVSASQQPTPGRSPSSTSQTWS